MTKVFGFGDFLQMFMYSASFLEYILRMLYSFEDIPKIAVLLLHMQDIVVQAYVPFQNVL